MVHLLAAAAMCLTAPVHGPVVSGYAPSGQYAGHWGIDFGSDRGEPVFAPVGGLVTFAGSVAGMKTVTIQPMLGVKVSLSYLDRIDVVAGARVSRGQQIGLAGVERGRTGVHLSVREHGAYVDPAPLLTCPSTDITRALRLVTPPQPYPRRRAHRHSRRDFRPDSHRPPARRRSGTASGEPRSCLVHAGWGAVAEVGPPSVRGRASSGHDQTCDR